MNNVSIDASTVIKNLTNMDVRVQKGLNILGDVAGAGMLNYARLYQPWTNRTGSAKDLLHYNVRWVGTTLDVSIGHGVDYGVWLETATALKDRFKILEEARDSQVQSFTESILAMKL